VKKEKGIQQRPQTHTFATMTDKKPHVFGRLNHYDLRFDQFKVLYPLLFDEEKCVYYYTSQFSTKQSKLDTLQKLRDSLQGRALDYDRMRRDGGRMGGRMGLVLKEKTRETVNQAAFVRHIIEIVQNHPDYSRTDDDATSTTPSRDKTHTPS